MQTVSIHDLIHACLPQKKLFLAHSWKDTESDYCINDTTESDFDWCSRKIGNYGTCVTTKKSKAPFALSNSFELWAANLALRQNVSRSMNRPFLGQTPSQLARKVKRQWWIGVHLMDPWHEASVQCPVLAWLRSQATMPVAVPVLYEMHLQQKVNESSGGTCEFDSFRPSFLLQCSSAKALAQSIYHVYLNIIKRCCINIPALMCSSAWSLKQLYIYTIAIYIYTESFAESCHKNCVLSTLSHPIQTIKPPMSGTHHNAGNVACQERILCFPGHSPGWSKSISTKRGPGTQSDTAMRGSPAPIADLCAHLWQTCMESYRIRRQFLGLV